MVDSSGGHHIRCHPVISRIVIGENTGVCGQNTLVQYGALVSLVRSPLLNVFEVEHWCLCLDHPCSMVVNMKHWCLYPDHPCSSTGVLSRSPLLSGTLEEEH